MKEIKLTQKDRKNLLHFVTTGEHSAKLIRRANIILSLDTSYGRKPETDEKTAANCNCSRTTVDNVRNDFLAAENVERFLQRKKRETPPVAPKITGEVEARIIALACSAAPNGFTKWTLQMLADKSVENGVIDSISHMSIKRVLKKHYFNLT
jgi:hypothetical protein